MKKISKSDLKGLTEMFPVYKEDDMRRVVGGASVNEIETWLVNNFSGYGQGSVDDFGNYSWKRSSGYGTTDDNTYNSSSTYGYGENHNELMYLDGYYSALQAYLFNNDCFWRCVSYMRTGQDSASYAAELALQFFNWHMGSAEAALAYLAQTGGGMTMQYIQDYICRAVETGNYQYNSSGSYIGIFNTNNISSYESSNTAHAVVVKSTNTDGSLEIYDPQQDFNKTIPASEAQHVIRAMY